MVLRSKCSQGRTGGTDIVVIRCLRHWHQHCLVGHNRASGSLSFVYLTSSLWNSDVININKNIISWALKVYSRKTNDSQLNIKLLFWQTFYQATKVEWHSRPFKKVSTTAQLRQKLHQLVVWPKQTISEIINQPVVDHHTKLYCR